MNPHAHKKPLLSEDLTAVALALTFIITTAAGGRIAVPSLGWDTSPDVLLTRTNLIALLKNFLMLYATGWLATVLLGRSGRRFVVVFPPLFLLATLAFVLAGNSTVKAYNFEAVIFSLLLGLLLGNVFRIPEWIRNTLATELFVKIGLVILGTSILFTDLLKAGSLGLIQALVVVVSVWYVAFWVARRFRLDEELSLMLASAVSICGVSAAIATAGAIKGDSKKLSYVISIVLITAVPMMLIMPYAAHWLGLTPAQTGAWLGGTIDTTGAVLAAGSMAGEEALQVSTIVKFSQNVLLGLAAFGISIYWTYTHREGVEKPTVSVIWSRFPKFVLGFIAASLLFSFGVSEATQLAAKEGLKHIQNFWFVLAFVCIGLETRFSDLFGNDSWKPLGAFLLAQAFNIAITLLLAVLLFA
ncbi:MAG: YeiH family protein [Cyclobacteriaceae bacterium]|nr:YeiH family protein [Cyclobacteriaceae bacterium]